jgi:alkaline phosphatase
MTEVRKTKNVLLFIGDGMTTNMITAARLIAHKTVNGRYQSLMQLDKFPVLGHQMTHSLDSYITDSANSASALYTGHKSSVNALGVYADSSPNPFDDPKVETIAELFYRIYKGHIGIVSTAFIADATPAALTAHTRDRDQYGAVVDSFIHGIVNYTWTEWNGPDVLFGGGAEQFCNQSGRTYQGLDYYKVFRDAGYATVNSNTTLQAASSKNKTLGIFSTSNMAKWLDRNVYRDNLKGVKSNPNCNGTDALDQPGLKEMTIKAIDILNTRAGDNNGWFLMSEAASIDKQMHALDYDRALGELLELDDTVKASINHLQKLNALKDTLVIVTADHGHGFDVFGSVDTQYLNNKTDDRSKRRAVGTYAQSGLSQYINTGNLRYADSNFPSNWDPRYTLAQGFGANPDHRENYQVHKNGIRSPATNITGYLANNYFVNPADAVTGFIVNGTLPTSNSQGVHSLTDVPVFAQGPCSEIFGGVYNSIDVFYKMAECLGLSRSNPQKSGSGSGSGSSASVKSNSGTSSAASAKSSSSSSSSSVAGTGRPVTQISDGQIQAPTGTGSAKTTPTAASSKASTSAAAGTSSKASSAGSSAPSSKAATSAAATSSAASAQPYKTNPDNSGKYGPQFGYKQYGPQNPVYAC